MRPSTGRASITCSTSTIRSEEHTSELQSPCNLVCRLLLEKKKKKHVKTTVRHTTGEHIYMSARVPLYCAHTSLSHIFSFSCACGRWVFLFFFFFLKNRPPTEFSPFPLSAPLPS